MTLLFLLLFSPLPAKAEPYTFAQEGCEFLLDLPGPPYQAKRCDPDDPANCHKVTSYTKVFNLDATVNFNITCNAAEDGMYEHYSLDIMEATLAALAKHQNLDDVETGSQQFEEAKQAVVIGAGKTGVSDKLYTTQLWIGHKSVLTVEGEVIGAPVEDADRMFADILKSIRHAGWKETPKAEETEKTPENQEGLEKQPDKDGE